jgi:2'-5' RNA ligase
VSDDLQSSVEAALVILVPEVELLVGSFRLQHDPSAALGVPAHITINYPFLPGVDPTGDLYQELSKLFAKCDSFQFAFRRFARFPDVLYLAPEPDTPLIRLIDMVAACFPESPPYGGSFDSIIPHLTIAQSEDEKVLKSIERQLAGLSSEFLPLSIRAEQVWLMDNKTGMWRKRKAFSLGSK